MSAAQDKALALAVYQALAAQGRSTAAFCLVFYDGSTLSSVSNIPSPAATRELLDSVSQSFAAGRERVVMVHVEPPEPRR